jgi:rubrerythrin
MKSFWRKLWGGGRKSPDEGKGQYGVDYVGVSELMRFNKNLLDAMKHEKSGIELYTRFLAEANDERGREMYRKLLEEERRHIRMVEEEIEEHKKQGYWS